MPSSRGALVCCGARVYPPCGAADPALARRGRTSAAATARRFARPICVAPTSSGTCLRTEDPLCGVWSSYYPPASRKHTKAQQATQRMRATGSGFESSPRTRGGGEYGGSGGEGGGASGGGGGGAGGAGGGGGGDGGGGGGGAQCSTHGMEPSESVAPPSTQPSVESRRSSSTSQPGPHSPQSL